MTLDISGKTASARNLSGYASGGRLMQGFMQGFVAAADQTLVDDISKPCRGEPVFCSRNGRTEDSTIIENANV